MMQRSQQIYTVGIAGLNADGDAVQQSFAALQLAAET